MCAMPITDPERDDGYFDMYRVAATNLRLWLIAYGIGAPVLFLSNEHLWQAFSKTDGVRTTAILFLIGVGVQVFIASLNKSIMWFCYRGEGDPIYKNKRVYKTSDWLSEQFWIDIGCDLVSIVLFTIATYRVLSALVPGT